MQPNQIYTKPVENQEIMAETAVVMELLAFAMAIIAQPGTPVVLCKVMAILSYNCAINWAAMLHAEGGAQ